MALELPESTEECIYFTRRADDNGKIICWVPKEKCPECNEGLMGKPKHDDGKVKIRAKEYTCPKCNHSVEKKEYEDTLTANVIYTCPHCQKEGEIQIPFKRKKVQGADMLKFQCEGCQKDIEIAKKFKKKKEK
ncbi:MAG: hypothetical protein QF632_05780 [Candidatus Woesearchaeota archaeon]|jgi:ssDNA-binding Zn-finger/Zn-ribbon topoisomerase 1|nr:hypothetical protein [Candidatus Woesearchaeota archaeon]MDP7457287.1 hypothetical protein [Candidatus Woesearchaeota archaeon]|tara:strand:- start:375 stop:773 length:399 start_codon:yes stop_codon:yes gene_type:complete